MVAPLEPGTAEPVAGKPVIVSQLSRHKLQTLLREIHQDNQRLAVLAFKYREGLEKMHALATERLADLDKCILLSHAARRSKKTLEAIQAIYTPQEKPTQQTPTQGEPNETETPNQPGPSTGN